LVQTLALQSAPGPVLLFRYFLLQDHECESSRSKSG